MTLVKWNNEARPTLPNLMDNFFGRDIFDMMGNNGHVGSLPGVNVIESKDAYRLEVAIPGFKKDQFNLNLEKNTLTISAEASKEAEKNQENYTRREFSYGSFSRSFSLPQTADSEKIDAKYENGILLIHIPKKEEAKEKPARNIKVS